ncbi:hypothetical protein BJ165DRAFT_1451830 [Panaeolus papilionaceus]|nr:hypothetical protein BJ165DRAFT_1451830 [Panaeolus papilionaceus]
MYGRPRLWQLQCVDSDCSPNLAGVSQARARRMPRKHWVLSFKGHDSACSCYDG